MAKKRKTTRKKAADDATSLNREAMLRLNEKFARDDLVRAAERKLLEGLAPSRAEVRAVRAQDKENAEKYGSARVSNYPKGLLTKGIGRSPKVMIDAMAKVDFDWLGEIDGVDLVKIVKALIDTLLSSDVASALRTVERRGRLEDIGDGEEGGQSYGYWEVRNIAAMAQNRELKLKRELERWVPVEVMEEIARKLFEGELRTMIDDYDKREATTGTEVSARLRLMLKRFDQHIEESLPSNGDCE